MRSIDKELNRFTTKTLGIKFYGVTSLPGVSDYWKSKERVRPVDPVPQAAAPAADPMRPATSAMTDAQVFNPEVSRAASAGGGRSMSIFGSYLRPKEDEDKRGALGSGY